MTGERHRPADSAFLRDFAYLSSIGATPSGGVDREAATLPDAMQRAWLGGWLTSHGFDVRVDAIGNQFGLLELVPGAPYILTGSHLDSQPTAGRFDGAYGVAASAHAAHAVARRAREGRITPRHNLAVVNWFNEEGSRFAPSMMGSSVFTGKLSLESAYDVEDGRGVSVREALKRIGAIGSAPELPLAGYAEIHIEQGRELEDGAARIGVVTGTWGARKFLVIVDGEQAHTGPTAMADRRDALLGASLLVVRARELADELAHAPLHTAVSKLDVRPNSPVVVARRVVCNLDLRSPDPEALETAERLLREAAADIERTHGVSVRLDRTHHWDRNDYSADGVTLAEGVCADLGLASRRVLTVAGHDSTNVKDITPTVMLFVPSEDGISHNEREFTADDDMVAGLSVLTGVLERLCVG
ncbi:M20 family metallo-hydrolase [Microtetraspora fusca]|uniref:M20 family metallo-hydrolase n=1 Tax=Microtetraspora fusca TaxID=1997 RepID=UPI000830C361|nr:M20 family metallo-hydrolase [Microtetraspora fusca]